MNIIHGDSLEKLKELEDNSVDSIVTDPPYGLSFMGKRWDYDVPSQEIWEECLRVLKPGGYLLAFAGTRTQHRMAVRIEDAGFEIRDMIAWVYGSGFPKSLNIGKAIDKLQGNEREVVGEIRAGKTAMGQNSGWNAHENRTVMDATKGSSPYEGWGTALKPSLEPITVARKPISEKTVAENVLKYGTGGINIDECRVEAGLDHIKNATRHTNKIYRGGFNDSPINSEASPLGRFPANLIHDGSDEVVGLFPETKTGTLKPYKEKGTSWFTDHKIRDVHHKASDGSASRFFQKCEFDNENKENFAPNLSPIIMSRKPISEKTVAENVLKYGTGGINIDGCRVGETGAKTNSNGKRSMYGGNSLLESKTHNDKTIKHNYGRFPANLIHDGSDEVVGLFPNTKSGKAVIGTGKGFAKNPSGIASTGIIASCYADSGSASRFFYCAKSSKSERNKGCEDVITNENGQERVGNIHSTVKPISLMRYLCRLVTPKGGTVLDPFMGSGTTGIGAKLEGFDFIGIEREEEYIKIAEARINAWEEEKQKKLV
jgi:site-specific DNA-methyltransferase (adenine-specific)